MGFVWDLIQQSPEERFGEDGDGDGRIGGA